MICKYSIAEGVVVTDPFPPIYVGFFHYCAGKDMWDTVPGLRAATTVCRLLLQSCTLSAGEVVSLTVPQRDPQSD